MESLSNSNGRHAAGHMAQHITVCDSRLGRDVCEYGCVCIWWLGVCISMRIVCMRREVVCMHMGVYAYECVGIWVCMHRGVVCMHVSCV